MKSLLITVAIIAFLVVGGMTLRGGGGTTAPMTVPDAIDFRDQAGLTVEVVTQINAMRQVVAMGSPDASLTSTLAANDELKQHLESIEQNHRNAGASDQAIAQLRTTINWDEFIRQDAALRAAHATTAP